MEMEEPGEGKRGEESCCEEEMRGGMVGRDSQVSCFLCCFFLHVCSFVFVFVGFGVGNLESGNQR